MSSRPRSLVVALVAVLLLGGCTGGDQPETGRRVSAETDLSPETAPETRARTGRERLGLETGWGPDARELDRAADTVRDLSLRELAGQVIVADWRGSRAPVELVRGLHLGGVIWFEENITSLAQVRRVNRHLVRAADRPWPLLIGVDQEGGLVERVRHEATRFPSFMSAGAARRPELTRAAAEAAGLELRGLGMTANFAPVADVTVGASDPTIGARAVSSAPGGVATHALAAAWGLRASGLVATLKHFPGHGSVPADSHHVLPVQRRSLAQLRRLDLRPFADAVAGGVGAVMVGHLDVRAVDPGVPSSLSRRVVTGLLREELGFRGLVVTDSLAMGAVTRSRGPARAAVQALRAGADVLLMPADVRAAHRGIVAAVRDGRLSRRRLEQAAARQVALLSHHASVRGAAPGSARPASVALSRAAITLVAGPCQRRRMVGRRVQPVGDRAAVAAFTRVARRAGLAVGRRGARIAFLTSARRAPRAAVSVAVAEPWALAGSRSRVQVATYGRTPGAMRALLDVLVGEARAPGRLPVAVRGAARRGC